jgi:hypothetical protein
VLEIAIAGFAVAAVVVRGAVPGGPVLPATPTARLDVFSAGVARATVATCAHGCSRLRFDRT